MTFSGDSNDIIRAVREQQMRALAIEAILNNAPALGIDQAIERFGSDLTNTEREILKTLTNEELASLKSILSKLGTQIFFQNGIAF